MVIQPDMVALDVLKLYLKEKASMSTGFFMKWKDAMVDW